MATGDARPTARPSAIGCDRLSTRAASAWRRLNVQGHTRGILDTPRGRDAAAPVVQPLVAGACRNRTYPAPCEAELVLKTSRTTRPDPPPGAAHKLATRRRFF